MTIEQMRKDSVQKLFSKSYEELQWMSEGLSLDFAMARRICNERGYEPTFVGLGVRSSVKDVLDRLDGDGRRTVFLAYYIVDWKNKYRVTGAAG